MLLYAPVRKSLEYISGELKLSQAYCGFSYISGTKSQNLFLSGLIVVYVQSSEARC